MSITRTLVVWAEAKPGRGWTYTLAEIESFVAECRRAGIGDDRRIVRANGAGQLGAFDDSPG